MNRAYLKLYGQETEAGCTVAVGYTGTYREVRRQTLANSVANEAPKTTGYTLVADGGPSLCLSYADMDCTVIKLKMCSTIPIPSDDSDLIIAADLTNMH